MTSSIPFGGHPELSRPIAIAEIQPLIDRLLAKRTVSERGCWVWGGQIHRSGYGQMSWHDFPVYIHRLAWALWRGPIPRGLFVLHHCDNRPCFRPDDDHLFLGTQRDNVDDMITKGRERHPPRFGVDNVKTKDAIEVVERAKKMHAEGTSQRDIAEQLAVSQSTVWRWVHGETRTRG